MSDKKLLPCPFCGGEAIILSESDYEAHAWYRVECNECDCKTGSYVNECGKEEAIENWNTRKPMEKIVERLNNNFRKVKKDEDLEWNRAIDKTIEIVKEEGGLND